MATLGELEKDFKRLVKNEALSHAYVLYGPQVQSQFLFAQQLAQFLESGRWQSPTGVLLEAFFVDGGSVKLGVEMARSFSEFLYRQPVASARRTLVVSSAAELTSQAQNAILKLVEEPPAHGLIILTVRDLNSLLPALRSRLQAFYVAPTGERPALSERDERAKELVEQFLLARQSVRGAFIKELIANDKEDGVEKNDKIVDTFLSQLISELAKQPQANARALAQALRRQTAMADYSTNKKLQLEALAQYL